MIRLVRAELLRLRSRKLTWLALGAVLLVVALTQVAVYTSVKPLTGAELAEAQTQYEEAARDYQQHRVEYERQAEACVAEGNPSDACTFPEPRLEDFAQRAVTTFPEIAGVVVTVSVFVTALALLFVSASLVGAEFASGSLANWLSFVPERSRVYAAKLVALVLAGAVATPVTAGLGLGAAVLLTRLAGADVSGLGRLAAMTGRGVLVGVVAVVVGFSLAMLTRHTIAAAATVLGYLFLSFALTVVAGFIPALQAVQRLLPENNALALLNRGHRYTTYVNEATATGEFTYREVEHVISWAQAGIYWGVVAVALLTASYLVFRRRDVN